MAQLQYEIKKIQFKELKGQIEIPKFQRGLVWAPEKKKEFIKTLKAGLPIGILLVAPNASGDKYLIIDGLQRFTTMTDYDNNPFKYIEESEITDLDLLSIIMASDATRTIYDQYQQKAKDDMLELMRKIIIDTYKEDGRLSRIIRATNIANGYIQKIAPFNSDDFQAIQVKIYDVLERIENNSQIDDVEIPLIIFKGKEELLADIFQKLNQEGVRLTKYDVFAATWINHIVTVKDDKFIDLIISKYEKSQEDSGLDISDYDPDEMKRTGELTVYEYAFALGKALMNKCDKIFKAANEQKVESIGFLILAELLGLTYQDMSKLAERIDDYDKVDYNQLKDCIIEATQIVERALENYIISPNGKTKKTSLACHSELQLASYIITVFKLKYDITKENGIVPKTGRVNELRNVKFYLHKHYLYDILRDFWSGAGDSKLEDIIRDPATCRYTRDVDKDSFEQTILTWLDSSIEKTVQNTVSAQNKLFWNYYLRKSGVQLDGKRFDIEHCSPQKTIKEHILKKGEEIPVSSACNLCYIEMSDNRGKGEYTYYQKQDVYGGAFSLNEAELDKLLYPSKAELQFLNSVETITKDNYMQFLNDRKNVIANRMIKVLYP